LSGEFGIVRRCFAPLAKGEAALGLGDDAAVFSPPPGRSLVATADAMISGVHFLPDDPPDTIARKLLRVNLSDLAAMGAEPLGYLLTCAWPKGWKEDWIEGFAQGLAEDQERYGIALLGGDTVGTPGTLSLSLTALGTVEAGRAMTRSGARVGDSVFVSGTLGRAAFGLLVRRGGLLGLNQDLRTALTEAYRLPDPRLDLGRALVEKRLATACLDVSDGLLADLGHICQASGLGAVLWSEHLPLSEPVQEAVAEDLETFPLVLTGGDDYELCFTAAPGAAEELMSLAQQLGLPLTQVGEMQGGSGVRVLDRDGNALIVQAEGWQHF